MENNKNNSTFQYVIFIILVAVIFSLIAIFSIIQDDSYAMTGHPGKYLIRCFNHIHYSYNLY